MTLLQKVYDAIDDKFGEDIVVLDMRNISIVNDYTIITHADTTRKTQAIARNVAELAAKEQISIGQMEGFQEGRWILIDMQSIVVHVFQTDERDHYNLEKLWRDAPLVTVEQA